VRLHHARVIESAGGTGAYANGSVYEPRQAPAALFEGNAVRGTVVIPLGWFWEPALHRASEEWFGDVVLNGKGDKRVQRRHVRLSATALDRNEAGSLSAPRLRPHLQSASPQ